MQCRLVLLPQVDVEAAQSLLLSPGVSALALLALTEHTCDHGWVYFCGVAYAVFGAVLILYEVALANAVFRKDSQRSQGRRHHYYHSSTIMAGFSICFAWLLLCEVEANESTQHSETSNVLTETPTVLLAVQHTNSNISVRLGGVWTIRACGLSCCSQ